MSRLGRRGIAFKTSLVTGGLLIACTALIFCLFYFMLPSFYHQYKVKTLNEALDRLIDNSATLSLQDAKPALNAFTQEHNVWLGIRDKDMRYYYVPSVFPDSIVESGDLAPARRIDITKPINDTYEVDRPISFLNGRYTLVGYATLQPINEASRAILLFAPYMIVLVLLISAGGAIAYSRFITRPLISINQSAKQMANLEFDRPIDIRSEDEIGELSRSLNRLSRNLQATMSELREANDQLSDDIRKERELEEKRREFIATISHELKTPITAVMGQLEGMIHRIGAYKDRDKYLLRSYTIMQDMERLVHELLELSKLEARESGDLHWEKVDLSQVVRMVLRQLEYASGAKRIDTVFDIADDISIWADPKLIRKAISNVIQNAIQYADTGGRVRVRLTQTASSAELQVVNTGEPIPADQLQRIFEPFYRIEQSRSRNTGGSGLGLYIVKQVLEAHGADYSVDNTSEGVAFVLAFRREDPR